MICSTSRKKNGSMFRARNHRPAAIAASKKSGGGDGCCRSTRRVSVSANMSSSINSHRDKAKTFYWTRPLGSPIGTMRFSTTHVVDDSRSGRRRSSCLWATPRTWRELDDIVRCHCSSERKEGIDAKNATVVDALEIAGAWETEAAAGDEEWDWVDACEALTRRCSDQRSLCARNIRSLSFVNADCLHAKRQVQLLQSFLSNGHSLERLELHNPRSYIPVLRQLQLQHSKENKYVLHLVIRGGVMLSVEDCSVLGELLSSSSSFTTRQDNEDCSENGSTNETATLTIAAKEQQQQRPIVQLRTLAVHETPVDSYRTWLTVFKSLESSQSLERVQWKLLFDDGEKEEDHNSVREKNHDGTDNGVASDSENDTEKKLETLTAQEYLEGKYRFNQLRRCLLEQVLELERVSRVTVSFVSSGSLRTRRQRQNPTPKIYSRAASSNKVRFRSAIEVIDGAVGVLHEWWRSTHRPPIAQHQKSPAATVDVVNPGLSIVSNEGEEQHRTPSSTMSRVGRAPTSLSALRSRQLWRRRLSAVALRTLAEMIASDREDGVRPCENDSAAVVALN